MLDLGRNYENVKVFHVEHEFDYSKILDVVGDPGFAVLLVFRFSWLSVIFTGIAEIRFINLNLNVWVG